VRVKLTSAAFTGANGLLQPQPPLFGRVTAFNSPAADIATEDGRSLSADASSLDEIIAANSTQIQTWLDQVVVGVRSDGQQFTDGFTGRVVGLFTIGSELRLLIRSLTNGMYYELPATSVGIQEGR